MNKPELQVTTYEWYDFYEFFDFLRQKFGRYIDKLEEEYEDIQSGDDFVSYGFDDYFRNEDALHPQIADYILEQFGTTSITLGR